jgi:ribosomal protein S27E
MKVQCANCEKIIRELPPFIGDKAGKIIRVICPQCFREQYGEVKID